MARESFDSPPGYYFFPMHLCICLVALRRVVNKGPDSVLLKGFAEVPGGTWGVHYRGGMSYFEGDPPLTPISEEQYKALMGVLYPGRPFRDYE